VAGRGTNELAVKQRRLTPRGGPPGSIVSVAAQLMFEHGVAARASATSRRRRRRRLAGLHYFEDKQSLIRAVIAYRTEAILGTVRPQLGRLDSMEALRAGGTC